MAFNITYFLNVWTVDYRYKWKKCTFYNSNQTYQIQWEGRLTILKSYWGTSEGKNSELFWTFLSISQKNSNGGPTDHLQYCDTCKL